MSELLCCSGTEKSRCWSCLLCWGEHAHSLLRPPEQQCSVVWHSDIGLDEGFRDPPVMIQQALVLFFEMMLGSPERHEDQRGSSSKIFQRAWGCQVDLRQRNESLAQPSTLHVCYHSSLRPSGLCSSVYLYIMHTLLIPAFCWMSVLNYRKNMVSASCYSEDAFPMSGQSQWHRHLPSFTTDFLSLWCKALGSG